MTGVPQSIAVELMTSLQRTSGSVTEFLEHLAGELIDADILSQIARPAGNDNSLGLASDAEMVRRTVLLTGRISGRNFVYAESAIAVERLPDSVRQRLELSRDPIGRVLSDHRLSVRREPLAGPVIAVGNATNIANLLDGAALSRRYRIMLGSDPAIVVSEWFLQTVPEALAAHGGQCQLPSPRVAAQDHDNAALDENGNPTLGSNPFETWGWTPTQEA